MTQSNRATWCVLAVTAVSLLPLAAAHARRIQVDFGPESFPQSGAGWPGRPGVGFDGSFDDGVDLTTAPSDGSLAFTSNYFDADGTTLLGGPYTSHNLLIGGVSYDSFRMFEDGSFSFFDSTTGPVGTDPLFGVFATDLVSQAYDLGNGTFNSTGDGSTSHTEGFSLGLQDVPTGTDPDPALASAAIRLFWNNIPLAGDPDQSLFQFQAYIYFLGNGDFDVDMRYASPLADGALPGSPGNQFISAGGADLFRNTVPLVSEGDYFFRFRGGVLQGGTPEPPTDVAEPGTLTLLLVGLAGLLVVRRRKQVGAAR